ncbi:MAG: nucleotidyltransferase domain-containing protein [Actinomycetota bacterium]
MEGDLDAELQERRKRLDEALDPIVRHLVRMGAQLVVLFGSEARGERNPMADLDILAVMETAEPFVERLARAYRELRPGVALDLLIYTPKEFDLMRVKPFVQRILEEGRVLYAA